MWVSRSIMQLEEWGHGTREMEMAMAMEMAVVGWGVQERPSVRGDFWA